MSANDEKNEIITNRDRDINAFKAGLKLLPGGVGEALIQFFSGNGEEARWRRLQATIQEAVDMLKERNRESEVADNENFGDFFTKAAEPIERSTNEDKRQRFRDLLFNSMLIPPDGHGWEESMYCLDLLQKIPAAGLYVLAMVARTDRDDSNIALTSFTSGTPQWVIVPAGSLQAEPILVDLVAKFDDLKYDSVFVIKEIESLTKETKLIYEQRISVTKGRFTKSVNFLILTDPGRFLVKWTMAEF